MKKILKNKILILSAILYVVLFFVKRELFVSASKTTLQFIIEMMQVMPPILIITSLITIWVPAHVIAKNFGDKSGFKGVAGSIFIGSISAGPIYAAFPLCQTLLTKGASLKNITIIISAWAVIKIPMILIEASFLGTKFAALRYLFTIPSILFMAYIIDGMHKKKALVTVNVKS